MKFKKLAGCTNDNGSGNMLKSHAYLVQLEIDLDETHTTIINT